ncbi:MAG: CapA family protein [Clostridia bacterium]|nr:CapA family protein [Clostridia bacterium]
MEKLIFENNRTVIDKEEKKALTVLFAGDLCPVHKTEALILNGHSKDIIAPLGDSFFDRDLAIVNLEAPLTKNCTPIRKTGPNLKLDPGCVSFLKEASFDVVSLANNHMGDYGYEPVMETIKLLKENEIKYVGAGENLEASKKALNFKKNGVTISILAYAEYEFGIAEKNTPGAAPFDPVTAIREIRKQKAISDIVLVIIHGGNERCPVPNPAMVNALRALAEAGATAVIAMHTHCPQGIEIHEGVPIVYSLGNFLFDSPHAKRPGKGDFWWSGYMTKISFSGNKALSLEVIPYTFWPDGTAVYPLEGHDKEMFIRYLMHLSDLILKEDERLRIWNAWCAVTGPFWIDWFKKASYPVDENDEKAFFATMVIRNGFTCMAHYEVARNFMRMLCEGRLPEAKTHIAALEKLQRGEV